jgi:purine-nucleoside phosphorylase
LNILDANINDKDGMNSTQDHAPSGVLEAAHFLQQRLDSIPQVAVITGTGLGDIAHGMEVSTAIEYGKIPHFPQSTVQTHQGVLLSASAGSDGLLVLQGRFHLYEGYTPQAVTFPVRVLQELGVHTLILTNASGGLCPDFTAGDIMIIRDHINLTGVNPLVGANEERWGSRFPEMTSAYSLDLADAAEAYARRNGIRVQRGVYAGLLGPSLETPAEMRYLRTIGADAVGFSTVMEAIAAVHGGMRLLGLSMITNMNLPDNLQPASVEDIIARARAASPYLSRLIRNILSVAGHTP